MRKRVLIISTKLAPFHAGDSIFSAGLIYRLKNDCDLTIVTLGDKTDFQNTEIFDGSKLFVHRRYSSLLNKILKIIFTRSLKQDFHFGLKRFIKKIVNENSYDHIIIDHLRSFSVSKSILNARANVIYMAHNNESLNIFENWKFSKPSFLYRLLDKQILKYERFLLARCNELWTLTQDDYQSLGSPEIKHQIIHPYFPYKRVKEISDLKNSSFKLLFLGTLSWYPNTSGLIDFIKNAFPLVLKVYPNTLLQVVGSNPPNELYKYESSNVKIIGKVENVDSYIKNSDILIIPNRSGTGLKIKIMEAIIKGIPVIMFNENKVGYESNNFTYPFVVTNYEEFVKSILDLFEDYESKKNFIELNREILLNPPVINLN